MPEMKNSVLQEAPPADKLIGFREVNRLVGLACKTSHSVRNLARRGLIRQVRLNDRCLRFSENSVLQLIAGRNGGLPATPQALAAQAEKGGAK